MKKLTRREYELEKSKLIGMFAESKERFGNKFNFDSVLKFYCPAYLENPVTINDNKRNIIEDSVEEFTKRYLSEE